MTARYDIRFIHDIEEKSVAVTAHLAEDRRIATAAAGADENHDRAGNGKSRPFYAEALSTRRVKSQRSRRIIDEVRRRNELRRNLVAAASY